MKGGKLLFIGEGEGERRFLRAVDDLVGEIRARRTRSSRRF